METPSTCVEDHHRFGRGKIDTDRERWDINGSPLYMYGGLPQVWWWQNGHRQGKVG